MISPGDFFPAARQVGEVPVPFVHRAARVGAVRFRVADRPGLPFGGRRVVADRAACRRCVRSVRVFLGPTAVERVAAARGRPVSHLEVLSALLVDEVKKHPDGRVDLLGLFEDVYLPSVPVRLDHVVLFLDLAIGDADKGQRHDIEVHLLDADGKPTQPPLPIRFVVPANATYARSTAQLDLDLFELTFNRWGEHVFDVRINGVSKRRVFLGVHPAAEAP